MPSESSRSVCAYALRLAVRFSGDEMMSWRSDEYRDGLSPAGAASIACSADETGGEAMFVSLFVVVVGGEWVEVRLRDLYVFGAVECASQKLCKVEKKHKPSDREGSNRRGGGGAGALIDTLARFQSPVRVPGPFHMYVRTCCSPSLDVNQQLRNGTAKSVRSKSEAQNSELRSGNLQSIRT